MAKKSIPALRKEPIPVVKDIWKPYVAGHDSPRYYECEFAGDERYAIYDAIREKTGLDYVNDLMNQSMKAFGEAHGVPYCETFCDDALVYCCIQLGIDYKKFPHNTPKLSIKNFVAKARIAFASWKPATNDIERSVQQKKLYAMWLAWSDEECERNDCPYDHHYRCRERYEDTNFRVIADSIANNNEKRERMLKSVDAKPRGKSVKIANDALSRILVSTRR